MDTEVMVNGVNGGEGVLDVGHHVVNGVMSDNGELAVPTPKVSEMNNAIEIIEDNKTIKESHHVRSEENSFVNASGDFVAEKNREETAISSKSTKSDEMDEIQTEATESTEIVKQEKEKHLQTDEGLGVTECNASYSEKQRSTISTEEAVGEEGDQIESRVKNTERMVTENKSHIDEELGADGSKAVTEKSFKAESDKTNETVHNDETGTTTHMQSHSSSSKQCETRIESGKTPGQGGFQSGALVDIEFQQTTLREEKGKNIFDSFKEPPNYLDACSLSHGLDGLDMMSMESSSSQVHMSSSKTAMRSEFSNAQVDSGVFTCAHDGAGFLAGSAGDGPGIPAVSAVCNTEPGTPICSNTPLQTPVGLRESPPHFPSFDNYKMDTDRREYSPDVPAPDFKPRSRTDADDLVARILAESRGDAPKSSSGSRPSSRPSGTPENGVSGKIAIDGAHELSRANSQASYRAANETTTSSVSAKSSNVRSSSTSTSESTLSEKAVGAERHLKDSSNDNSTSMLNHQSSLESKLDGKLGNIFSGKDEEEDVMIIRRPSAQKPELKSMNMSLTSEKSFASSKQESSMSSAVTSGNSHSHVMGSGGSERVVSEKHADKDDFDELDEEISSMRNKYRNKYMDQIDDEEEDSGISVGSGRGGTGPRPNPYMEEDEYYQPQGGYGQQGGYGGQPGFGRGGRRPQLMIEGGRGRGRGNPYGDEEGYGPPGHGGGGYGPPPGGYSAGGYYGAYGNPEEEYIPDEEFIPQRREETDQVVKEKTAAVRRLVEQQDETMQKLRRASESFDEINDEIKKLRQEFVESQARRITFDQGLDDEDDEDPYEQVQRNAPGPYVPGSYIKGSYGKYRNDLKYAAEPEYSMYSANGDADDLTCAEDMKQESSYSSSSSSYAKSRFGLKKYGAIDAGDEDDTSKFSTASTMRSKYGRSKSLYDDETPYTSSAANYEAGEDAYTAPRGSAYTSKYGASTDSSRLSYTSRFSGEAGEEEEGGVYGGRPRYQRSFTLGDIESPYSSGALPSSGSEFTSRFLQKVRDNKGPGGPINRSNDDSDIDDSKSSGKPFKSRFLKKSFSDASSSKISHSTRAFLQNTSTSSISRTNGAEESPTADEE